MYRKGVVVVVARRRKEEGGRGLQGGFGVERDVFNACFILCFLREGGNNACLV